MINSDRPYVESFHKLMAFSSAVKDEVTRREASNATNVGILLEAARGDTRRSHASAVKDSIGNWHAFNPGLTKKKDALWGFDHIECARLLCPPTTEWNEE